MAAKFLIGIPIVFGNRRYRKEMGRRARNWAKNSCDPKGCRLVVFNCGDGFQLAVERGDSLALVELRKHRLQREAKAHGRAKYGSAPHVRHVREAA